MRQSCRRQRVPSPIHAPAKLRSEEPGQVSGLTLHYRGAEGYDTVSWDSAVVPDRTDDHLRWHCLEPAAQERRWWDHIWDGVKFAGQAAFVIFLAWLIYVFAWSMWGSR